ncbi:MAG: hypothetical protein WBK28_02250 [Minisyncoccia bacterium]
MIHFLDFDRTLFNTDAFKEYLAVRENDSRITEEPEIDVGKSLDEQVQRGELSFAPGELVPFIYPDVPEFLRQLGNEAIIITFGNTALQQLKVTNALAGSVRVTALYTGDVLKGEFLKKWPGYYGQEAFFVDDRVHELEIMSTLFPAMRTFEMRRDGAPGDGRWYVVHSLSDLPAV